MSPLLRSTALSAAFLLCAAPGFAQSNPGYFIPPQGRPAQQPQQPPRQSAPRQAPPRQSPVQPMVPNAQNSGPGPIAGPGAGPGAGGADEGPAMQMQLPPAPELPTLAKASPPPVATIGVLGIPEIMRASTAAQQVEKTIDDRRKQLNDDAQKEQGVWREMQQGLANDRSKLSADQIRAREKELQDRITNAQKTFRDRNRLIQEAGQYGLAQIERILVGVIRQVAESHGMNIVLHRAQVALNVNEFDITDQVASQINKTLPTVQLPADGVEPPMIAAAAAPAQPPAATPAQSPAATPASAPAPAAAPAAAPPKPTKP